MHNGSKHEAPFRTRNIDNKLIGVGYHVCVERQEIVWKLFSCCYNVTQGYLGFIALNLQKTKPYQNHH